MRIQYWGNSGFFLQIDTLGLIIDDISRGQFAQNGPLYTKQLFVLASHIHSDHFNPAIFEWRTMHSQVCYVLSGDIFDESRSSIPLEETAIRIDPDNEVIFDVMHIYAHASTDQGVAFDIRILSASQTLRIFHAGDLNDWHWQEEGDADWTTRQAAWFAKILDGIDQTPSIDIAFFPVDPRMGHDHERGALRFAERLQPRFFVPMHYGRHFHPSQTFLEAMSRWTKIMTFDHPGENITIDLRL